MPSKLILDPAEPGVNEVMATMKVGVPTVLREVTVVPTMIDQSTVEADVTEISLDETDTGAEPIEAGMPGGPPAVEDQLSKMPRENEGGFDQGQM